MSISLTTPQPPDKGFAVALPAALDSIATARSIVRRVTSFTDDDAESSFLVALTEIVANAIDEHQRLCTEAAVVLTLSLDGDPVVSISDQGAGIANDGSVAAAPEATSESGRGLALARAFVPALVIESSAEGTTVSLPLGGLGVMR